MKISHILICVGAAVGFAPPSLAYPTSTHAAMTGYVVARSRLQTDPTLLEQLGIKELIAAGDATAPFNFGAEGLVFDAASALIYAVATGSPTNTGLRPTRKRACSTTITAGCQSAAAAGA